MSEGGDAPPQRGSFDECTELSQFCPVEATVLGYAPSLGGSIFFAVAFGVCLIAAAYLGVKTKTWTFGAAITVGLILELGGYVGRALLSKNPWNKDAFQLQICTIVLAPTLFCAAIYLTLKHIALNLNPALSRLQPRWYPRIFLPADVTCLVVQALGGALAAAADRDDRKLLDGGNNAIIAGIALQVVVLGAFGIMAGDYWWRIREDFKRAAEGGEDVDQQALALWRDGKFRKFGMAVVGAFCAVMLRCIYRIAEMAGGWGNHIMQDEISFTILDPTMILITCSLLTIFHPGLYFPQMSNGYRRQEKKRIQDSAEASESNNEAVKVEASSV